MSSGADYKSFLADGENFAKALSYSAQSNNSLIANYTASVAAEGMDENVASLPSLTNSDVEGAALTCATHHSSELPDDDNAGLYPIIVLPLNLTSP